MIFYIMQTQNSFKIELFKFKNVFTTAVYNKLQKKPGFRDFLGLK